MRTRRWSPSPSISRWISLCIGPSPTMYVTGGSRIAASAWTSRSGPLSSRRRPVKVSRGLASPGRGVVCREIAERPGRTCVRAEGKIVGERQGSRPVDEQAVEARGGLLGGLAVLPEGPGHGVVLAPDQRDAERKGGCGRPPRPEHVGVHEVRVGEPHLQPVREDGIRRPLARGMADLVVDLEGFCLEPEVLGQGQPLRGGVAGEQPGLDPEICLSSREPERGELGASRLEHADDPGDSHPRRVSSRRSSIGRPGGRLCCASPGTTSQRRAACPHCR